MAKLKAWVIESFVRGLMHRHINAREARRITYDKYNNESIEWYLDKAREASSRMLGFFKAHEEDDALISLGIMLGFLDHALRLDPHRWQDTYIKMGPVIQRIVRITL